MTDSAFATTLQPLRDQLSLKLVTLDPETVNIPAIGEILSVLESLTGALNEAGLPELAKASQQLEDLFGEMLTDLRPYDEGMVEAVKHHELLDAALEAHLTGGATAPLPGAEAAPAESATESPEVSADLTAVVQEVTEEMQGDETLAEFIGECEEGLATTEQMMLQLEQNPEDEQAINSVFRTVHTIKGTSGFLGLSTLGKLAHRTEDLLVQVRDGKRKLSSDDVDVVLKAVDNIGQLIEQVKQQLAEGEPEPADLSEVTVMLDQALAEDGSPAAAPETPAASADAGLQVVEEVAEEETSVEEMQLDPYHPDVEALRQAAAAEESVAPPQPQPQPPPEPEPAPPAAEPEPAPDAESPAPAEAAPASGKRATSSSGPVDMIKIPADKLDELSEFIGEMVVALSVLSQNPTITSIADREAQERLDQMHKITEQLRDRILSIRMFPVGNVFSKLKRQVRDLSRKSGKDIRLRVEGEDTLVDKTIIDTIYAPLMHIVRNAIDHGIEETNERKQADKPKTGNVLLAAHHLGDAILVEIQDDGRGLDRERLLNKAHERGIITDKDNLTDQQIFNFIFHPGFSTAEKVTDVSGRGVGMDVVRREVDNLRGKISIESTLGVGTTFKIKLPLTTSIIEGLVVGLGESRFVLPILDVHLTITPQKTELHDVQGQAQEYFLLAGEVVPIVRLYRYYDIEPRTTDPSQATIVVVNDGEKKYGLMVDEMLHRQQIVVKNLGDRFRDLPGITGGTILGDGRVGLILDPERLVTNSHGIH